LDPHKLYTTKSKSKSKSNDHSSTSLSCQQHLQQNGKPTEASKECNFSNKIKDFTPNRQPKDVVQTVPKTEQILPSSPSRKPFNSINNYRQDQLSQEFTIKQNTEDNEQQMTTLEVEE
jgi:hypothetical protein